MKYKIQHTNTNITMLCTKANQLIEIVIYITKNNVRCNNANNISPIIYYVD